MVSEGTRANLIRKDIYDSVIVGVGELDLELTAGQCLIFTGVVVTSYNNES